MKGKTCWQGLISGITLTALLAFATAAYAIETNPKSHSKSTTEPGKRATAKKTGPVDRQTEASARSLVASHLPELDVFLTRLREDQPRGYDRAIRDLARSARKLQAARNRSEELYEIELELLKAQTQVSLLTAKLKVRDNRSDRQQLRVSAARLHDAQTARLAYDVEAHRQRLKRTQQQLDAAESKLESRRQNSAELLEKSLLSMLRKAGREPGKTKSSSKTKSPKKK